MNRPLSTREQLLEQVDRLQSELATAQRYISDANEAINGYRHREADLLNELTTLQEAEKQWETKWNSKGEANAAGYNEAIEQLRTAHIDGFASCGTGCMRDANPHEINKPISEAWDAGWLLRSCRMALRATQSVKDGVLEDFVESQRHITQLTEAINGYRHRVATAKRDAERYRAALCNLLSVTGDCVVEVDDPVAYDDARDEAVEALNPKEDSDT